MGGIMGKKVKILGFLRPILGVISVIIYRKADQRVVRPARVVAGYKID